ncbi:MAG: hypothetical protein HY769_08565 [Candidatus Stahlbacteria bacterium]|nr:hypothetical protein [Candidatus Stahlbacteria bacterium]
MKKIYFLVLVFCLLGCEQLPDDPDNAIVSGYIYKRATPIDSVLVEGNWKYIEWDFYDPAESIHVWIESDLASTIPYKGPDIDGYTDKNGLFSIPIYLGHTEDVNHNYEYMYYADVRVFVPYILGSDTLMYDFGGGITLGRGKDFRLYPISLSWF